MKYFKGLIFILYGLISTLVGFAQNHSDTIFIKRDYFENDTLIIEGGSPEVSLIVPNTFLKGSESIFEMKNSGIIPISFDKITDIPMTQKNIDVKSKIDTAYCSDSILTIEITRRGNSCHEYFGDASLWRNTLIVTNTGFGEYCTSGSIYKLRYTFNISDITVELESVALAENCSTIDIFPLEK